MPSLRLPAALLALFSVAGSVLTADTAPPKLDKPKLEAYLRYTEGYFSGVKIAIDDPVASALPGYFRVLVHVSSGTDKLERQYYVTSDGQHVISGAFFDLNESPFKDTLARLPTDGYSFGPAKAPVTIVVFSDFQCPFCQSFAKTLRQEMAPKYPQQVRVIYKDFPLESIHNWARAAAEAARCIGAQKPEAFWAFHDWIFENQKEVNAANLREKTLALARQQKLDEAKVGACIDSHATASEVERSIQTAKGLMVEQTPTVFINGRIEPGALPWRNLDAIIQLELNRPKQVAGPGTL
jgi:protein-disulfide isomerase